MEDKLPIYINPFELMRFDSSTTPSPKNINKAKRRLLLEFELNNEHFLEYLGKKISKDEAIKLIDETIDFKRGYIHFCIFLDSYLSNFLNNGDITYFQKFKSKGFHYDQDFLGFIEPMYIIRYNLALMNAFVNNHFSDARKLIRYNLIKTSLKIEICYKNTKQRLITICRNLYLLTDRIQNNTLSYNDLKQKQLEDTVNQLINTTSLNILPDYFSAEKERIAFHLGTLSAYASQHFKNSPLALTFITKALKIDIKDKELKDKLIATNQQIDEFTKRATKTTATTTGESTNFEFNLQSILEGFERLIKKFLF